MPLKTDVVREHYDLLSPLYLKYWGEHLHHGYWEDGESPKEAQINLVKRLASFAGIRRGSRVLDVGSGLGGPAVWLAKNLACKVLGITISPVQVLMASGLARREGAGSETVFALMDAGRMDLPERSFDAVWIIEAFEHLADRDRFVRECARLLKPDGTFALCSWLDASIAPGEGRQMISDVCGAMLCPSLPRSRDVVPRLKDAGFGRVKTEDITARVAGTWDVCRPLLDRPGVKTWLENADEGIRRFASGFGLMREAYRSGYLRYGMFAASNGG